MSLINDMLQDLEKRRGHARERASIPRYVRVLPPVRKRSTARHIFNAVIGLACAAGIGWYAYQKAPSHLDTVAKVAAAAASATDTRSVEAAQSDRPSDARIESVSLPARIPTASVISTAAPPAPPTKSPKAAEQHDETKLSALSQANDAMPSPSGHQVAAPRPIIMSLRMDALPADRIVPSRSAASNSIDSGSPAGAQIDRKVRELSAGQLAENEYRLGATLLNQGRPAEAQERFSAALLHAPGHIGARQALFGSLLHAKRTAEAEHVLHEALKIDAAQPGFAMALARIQVDRGDTAAAAETLQNAAHVSQANPDYLAFLAALLQRQGRHAQAVEQYQAALALAPRAGIWHMGMAISLQALNRNSEAHDAFRRARAADGLTGELQAFVDQRLKQAQ